MPSKSYLLVVALLVVGQLLASIPSLAQECTSDVVYVADVTIPDDTIMKPGESFQKIWRIQNNGTCEWGAGYNWVFLQGDPMGAPPNVSALPNVKPGQAIDIPVSMVAPTVPGTYAGYWQMVDGTGRAFGPIFFVRIIVSAQAAASPPVQPTSPPAAQPTAQPTAQASPTAATEWKTFATEDLEISLPSGYEGGDTSSEEFLSMMDAWRKLGPELEEIAQLFDESAESFVFVAVEVDVSDPVASSAALIGVQELPYSLPMSQLLQVLAPMLTAGNLRVTEQKGIELSPYEAGLIIAEPVDPSQSAKQAFYLIKEGSNLWVVVFATHIDRFDQQMSEFEQSIHTFKPKP